MTQNLDRETVRGFGAEWSRFDQSELDDAERQRIFDNYFDVFPWDRVGPDSVGADIGCGSGRWALLVAPRVGALHCVDPSAALDVARRNLIEHRNVRFHRASVDTLPFEDATLDFAYSLGVLHHIPDTAAAIASVGRVLKPGAPMLLYLYYAFENRPFWFRALWRSTDVVRRAIARFPTSLRFVSAQLIAGGVYWPMARSARALERLHALPSNFPLAAYRDLSFYTMQTDALDRFGTRLEHRFTRTQITDMLKAGGFRDIIFSPRVPYWCCVATKG